MRRTRTLVAALATTICLAAPLAAQHGRRTEAPTGAEIARAAKAATLDETNRLTAEFQGKPITFTPAADNASLGSNAELRAGRFLGVLQNEAAGDETGLPPGTYNIFVAQVGGKWRAFAEANGEIVREAIRVRFAKAEGPDKKPRFREKGWAIEGPVCCLEEDPLDDPTVVADVSVSPGAASLQVGQTAQLAAKLINSRGEPVSGKGVVWTSSNPAAAPVGTSGLVQGVAVGTAVISATSGGISGTATVTLVAPPQPTCYCTAVRLYTPSGTSTAPRQRLRVSAKPLPVYPWQVPSARPITWRTSDSTIARIAASGVSSGGDEAWADVEGVARGSALVTATHTDKSASVGIGVTSDPVVRVVILPAPVSVEVGTSIQLTGTPTNDLGQPLADRSVSWASSDPAVVTVSSSGLVTGVTAGTAVVSAASDGARSTAGITVTPAPVASVVVAPSPVSILSGATAALTASVRDAAGNVLAGRAVTWSSGNAAVVTVAQDGVIAGVAPGTTTVTATSEGKIGSASVTVQHKKVSTSLAVAVYW